MKNSICNLWSINNAGRPGLYPHHHHKTSFKKIPSFKIWLDVAEGLNKMVLVSVDVQYVI
jgi:hypothetical protein